MKAAVFKIPYSSIAILSLLLVLNAAFLKFNVFRCFNMLDMGAFLDASWRVYKGQQPYIDFIYYSGPVHLYMNAVFFQLFGFGKTAILAHVVTVNSIIITSVFLLLRNYLSSALTASVSLLTAMSFYWSVSHPWHDVSAHFWGVLAVLAVTRQSLTKEQKTLFFTWSAAGLFVVLSFFTKTNLGTAYVFVITAVLLGAFRDRFSFQGYVLGVLAGLIIGLMLIKFPKEYWEQCFLWNKGLIKDRLTGLFSRKDWFINYYWLIFVLVAGLVAVSRSLSRVKPLFMLFTGLALIGIYAINTGGMIKPANNFLWGIQMSLAFLIWQQAKPPQKFSRIFLVILLVITFFLTAISFQYGKELKVWTYWNPKAKAEGNYALQSEPLRGWKFYSFQGKPLDYLTEYLRKHVPAEDSVLNLTDMYIINAMTGREGYKGIPFMFLEGTIPLPGPEVDLVRKNILSDPPDWIITDITSFVTALQYLGLYEEIFPRYTPVVQWGVYVLVKRNSV